MTVPWKTDERAAKLDLIWPRVRWQWVCKRLNVIRRMSAEEQAHLLRDHKNEGVYEDVEIELRAAMDELIGIVSFLELGWMSKWDVPQSIPSSFVTLCKELLLSNAGLVYTVRHYPVQLPTLALYRLETGRPAFEANGAKEGAALVFEMQRPRVVQYLNDPDTWEFLYFLDDFEYTDYSFKDLMSDLSDPEKVAASFRKSGTILVRSEKLSTIQRSAIRGAWSFISYCAETSKSLQRSDISHSGILASAYWHFFSYWVDSLRENKSLFNKAIRDLGRAVNTRQHRMNAEPAFSEMAWKSWLDDVRTNLRFLYGSRKNFSAPILAKATELRKEYKWLRPEDSKGPRAGKTPRSINSRRATRARGSADNLMVEREVFKSVPKLPTRSQISKEIGARIEAYSSAREGRLNLVAHGDSWFDYPISNPDYPNYSHTDIIVWLQEELIKPRPHIANIAHYGDATDDILSKRKVADLVRALQARKADAILLSGGGNDFIVKKFDKYIVDASSVGRDPDKAIASEYQGALDRIVQRYQFFKTICDTHAPGVPIFFHSYDFARPTGVGVLGCALGPWLFPVLKARGWMAQPKGSDLSRGSYILRLMLQQFDERLRTFAEQFPNVTALKTQGIIKQPGMWDNETHLKPEGFREIAKVFAGALAPLLA